MIALFSFPLTWPDVLLAAVVATLIVVVILQPWAHEHDDRWDDDVTAVPECARCGRPLGMSHLGTCDLSEMRSGVRGVVTTSQALPVLPNTGEKAAPTGPQLLGLADGPVGRADSRVTVLARSRGRVFDWAEGDDAA